MLDIDFAALQRQGSFLVRPRFEHKSTNTHGTRITIRQLKQEQAIQIAAGIRGATQKSVAGLRKWIGRTYTRFLREADARLGNKPLRIIANGEPVRPYRWCIWDQNRYVTVGAASRFGEPEKVPAFHPINTVLGGGLYCTNCLSWQPESAQAKGQCAFCRETALVERIRKMKGWIGVQRHLHDEEYGLDFLRNGRAILQWDKQVFSWTNPANNRKELEYPIDEMRERHGRIVGEVEIDHVHVHYQKDSFEESSLLWTEVINELRGRSPLRPQVATRHNLPRNESHLWHIYRGYDRTRTEEGGRYGQSERGRRDPWAKDLIISQPVAEQYYERFLEDDPEYQSDQKWYEWLMNADAEMNRRGQASQAQGENGNSIPSVISPAQETVAVHRTEQDSLRENAEMDTELSGEYGFEPARVLEVKVYRTNCGLWRKQRGTRLGVPVLAFSQLSGGVECFCDPAHPRLSEQEAETQELVIAEVAVILRERHYERLPYSYVLDHLRRIRLPDLSRANLTRQAYRLVDELWTRFVRSFETRATGVDTHLRDLLTEEDIRQISRTVAEAGGGQLQLESILQSGEFLKYMPNLMSRILRQTPDRFLDNKLFAVPFHNLPQGLTEQECQELGGANASRMANLLEDIANASRPSRFELTEIERRGRRRAFGSIDLIRELLVAT